MSVINDPFLCPYITVETFIWIVVCFGCLVERPVKTVKDLLPKKLKLETQEKTHKCRLCYLPLPVGNRCCCFFLRSSLYVNFLKPSHYNLAHNYPCGAPRFIYETQMENYLARF